jgi:GTPase
MELTIMETNGDYNHGQIRVTVLGNVDAGKSTIIGVLTKGQLDDGRGTARGNVMNYPHEV